VSSGDVVLGIAMLAIAATYYVLGTAIPDSALDDAVGPRGLPRIYAIVLAMLAVVTIVRGALARRRAFPQARLKPDMTERDANAGPRTRAVSWRFVGTTLIGVVYLAVVPWLGYLVSIALLIAATAWYQGGTLTGRVLLVASSGALLLWLLFVALLGIPQPSGAWSAIF
jgi:putative tricarboxylic transport membrane protein